MKLCTDDAKKDTPLRVRDLDRGDVFMWHPTHGKSPMVMICAGQGKYTVLIKGMLNVHCPGYYQTDASRNYVLRYPNACVQLGDPE